MKKQVFDVMDTNLCILNIDLIITNTKKGTRCLLDDICLPYNEALLLKKDFQNTTLKLKDWIEVKMEDESYYRIITDEKEVSNFIEKYPNKHYSEYYPIFNDFDSSLLEVFINSSESNKEKWSYLINKKILDNFVEEIVSNSINLEGETV